MAYDSDSCQSRFLSSQEPTLLEDSTGIVVKSTVATFGDTVHSFIERDRYTGTFLPGYKLIENPPPSVTMSISEIDHVAISLKLAIEKQVALETILAPHCACRLA